MIICTRGLELTTNDSSCQLTQTNRFCHSKVYSTAWLAVPSPARVITLQTSLSAATMVHGPVKHIMKISSVMQSEKMIVTLIYGE